MIRGRVRKDPPFLHPLVVAPPGAYPRVQYCWSFKAMDHFPIAKPARIAFRKVATHAFFDHASLDRPRQPFLVHA